MQTVDRADQGGLPATLGLHRTDPNDVLTWTLASDAVGPRHLAAYRETLDAEELVKAGRFKFERDRRSYICAHALSRCLLSTYGDAIPQAWRFRANSLGKPEIEEPRLEPSVRFSLSHTNGLVACAATRERDLGLDVECIERDVAVSELAERYFAREEADILRVLDPDARNKAFFCLWTLKEAYIKAVGRGLSMPLDSFAIRLEPLAITFCNPKDGNAADWDFRLLRPQTRHSVAVAVRCGQLSQVNYRHEDMTPDELVARCRGRS